jgi:hypothetical protein
MGRFGHRTNCSGTSADIRISWGGDFGDRRRAGQNITDAKAPADRFRGFHHSLAQTAFNASSALAIRDLILAHSHEFWRGTSALSRRGSPNSLGYEELTGLRRQ